mgnify:CR=1 FL=1
MKIQTIFQSHLFCFLIIMIIHLDSGFLVIKKKKIFFFSQAHHQMTLYKANRIYLLIFFPLFYPVTVVAVFKNHLLLSFFFLALIKLICIFVFCNLQIDIHTHTHAIVCVFFYYSIIQFIIIHITKQ